MICKFKYFDLTKRIMTEYINFKNRDLIISTDMSKRYMRLRIDRNKMRGIKIIVYVCVIRGMISDMYWVMLRMVLIECANIRKGIMSNLPDTINRLMNLGIVRIDDNDKIVFTDTYIDYLTSIYHRLKHIYCYASMYSNSYTLLIDCNAYALASWVGSIRESEFIELLNAIICIWGGILYDE